MTILDKYLSREIFRYFFMVLVLVVAIYLAVDFFEKIDNFMEAGLPFSRAIDFFFAFHPVCSVSDHSGRGVAVGTHQFRYDE
jgi:lipopolysaccharide export system permease protein